MVGTCMIVEHDPWNIQLLTMYAARLGLHLLHAFDGHEAILMAQKSRPDVILVDINLPGSLDGLGVVGALLTNTTSSHIPVILTVPAAHPMPSAGIEGTTCLRMPPTYVEFTTAMADAGICCSDADT